MMKTIVSLLVYACFLKAGHSQSVDPSADLKAALDFIECSQKAIITGIPEAGIPSHNPLKFAKNATYNLPLGLFEITVQLNNMVMDGIPWWNVTEAVQVVSDDPNVDIFKFTIYWPMMSFYVDWEFDYKSVLDHEETNGTLYMELDHVNFHIGWTSTKPQSEKSGTLDAFSLDIDTKESQVNITNLGIIGDLINTVGGEAVTFLVNHNPVANEFSDQLKERLVTEWVDKPEKIDAINSNCNK